MSRRRRVMPLKARVESLEARQLFSLARERPLAMHAIPAHPVASQAARHPAPRPDLDAFALQLVTHPREATRAGLGGLAHVVARDAGLAARDGWGACLAMELAAHPRYAAYHHLAALGSPALAVAPAAKGAAAPAAKGAAAVVSAAPHTPRHGPSTPVAKSGTSGTPPASPVAKSGTSGTPSASQPLPPVIRPTPPAGTGQQGLTTQTYGLSVEVGSTLDATVPAGGLSGTGLTYTITPQPLPANMTFNRGTGEIVFAPAPGEVGVYGFSVVVSDGTNSVTEAVPVTVTDPATPSTEVSGQVVDESGHPLIGVPVSVGPAMTVTDLSGAFTLTGLPAAPGPLTVDGLQTVAADRMVIMSPVDRALTHPLYAGVDNVVAAPITLPLLDTAHAVDFSKLDLTKPVDVTNPAIPGVHLTLPVGSAVGAGGVPFLGKLTLTSVPPSVARAELPAGVVTGLVEVDGVGLTIDRPVQITMPNTAGYTPGTLLDLWTMNWTTGTHDLKGHMVVSADGSTMNSVGGVLLDSSGMTAGAGKMSADPGTAGPGVHAMTDPLMTMDCIAVIPRITGPGTPFNPCGCPTTGNIVGNLNPPGGPPGTILSSDADLVTGEYYQDHWTVPYQSQGKSRSLDFGYSSLQANAQPVVQFDPSTQIGSESGSIQTITAQVTLAGVVQGGPVTYTPSNLKDGTTFRVPLQVDATQLASGAYTYTMVVTANYSGGPSLSQTYQGFINVVNGAPSGGASDPLGDGWSIGGVQQIYQPSPGGPALVTDGSQGTQRYDQYYTAGQAYYQDLATASASGTQVYTNGGTGEFTAGAATPPNQAALGTATGDFNGDGKPDLAEVSGTTLTIMNDAGGQLLFGNSYILPAGDAGLGVAAGNFTGHANGVLDLAVLVNTSTSGAVAVYTGNGDGTFSGPVVTPLGHFLSGALTLAVADFNGDGKSDLAVSAGGVDILLAGSGGAMTPAGSLTMPATNNPSGSTQRQSALGVTAVSLGGVTSLVVETTDPTVSDGAGSFANLYLYNEDGSGHFGLGLSASSSYQTGGHPDYATKGLVTGNFSGGTAVEVALPVLGDNETFVDLVPISSAGFSPGTEIPIGQLPGGGSNPANNSGNVVAADLNGTGKSSLALVTYSSNGTQSPAPSVAGAGATVIGGGGGAITLLLADPDSNQMLPAQTISTPAGGPIAVAPFAAHAASPFFLPPMGETATLTHNGGGTWTRTYTDGTVLNFNAAGRETSQVDRDGNTTSYAYVAGGAAAGALQTVTDPVGLVTTLAYDASGHIASVTDPAARVTHFTVDSNGNLTQVTDPDDALTQYGYASPTNHRITTETNPDDKTATAHYDGFGLLTGETLFDGTSTSQVGAALEKGLLVPGGSGPLPLPATFVGTVTDANGHATSLLFDNMDHATQTTDANSQGTLYTRDPMTGWVVSVLDPMNRTTHYQYDMYGNVTRVTRPDTTYETTTYDPRTGVPTLVTDFNDLTTTYTRDAQGDLMRRTDPDSGHEDYTYNAAGQVLTDTDRNGHTTSYTYDALGRPSTVVYPGPGAPTVRYGYDAAGDLTSTTDELGHVTNSTYDPAGRVLSVTRNSGTPAAAPPQPGDAGFESPSVGAGAAGDYAYDPTGTPWAYVGQAGVAGNGSAFTSSNPAAPDGTQVGFLEYTGSAAQTVAGWQAGAYVITFRAAQRANYQASRQDFRVTVDGQTVGTFTPSSTSYGGYSTAAFTVTAGAHTVGFAGLDTAGGDNTAFIDSVTVTAASAPAPPAVGDAGFESPSVGTGAFGDYAYDPAGTPWAYAGQVGVAGNGSGFTAGGPNAPEGTQVGFVQSHGSLSQSVAGWAAGTYVVTFQAAQRDNFTTSIEDFQVTVDGAVVATIDPSSAFYASYTTGAFTVAAGTHTVAFVGLDTAGGDNTALLDSVAVAPAAGAATTAYAYDPAGNLLSATDPLGHVTAYAYDARNREVGMTDPADQGTGRQTAYAYDARGNRTAATDPLGHATTYGYDPDNRLTSVTDPLGHVTTYVYDADGEKTYAFDPDGDVTAYGYDADGRLASTTLPGTATAQGTLPAARTVYGYDKDDDLTTVTDPLSHVTTYAYDDLNRRTSQTVSPGGTTLITTGYGYDAAGNATSVTDGLGHAATYAYDPRDRVTSVTDPAGGGTTTYAYDAAGNLTGLTDPADNTTSWGYDREDRRTTETDPRGKLTTYVYDPADDLTQKTDRDGRVTTYGYDADNRPTTQTWVDPLGGTPADVFTAAYDAAGRLTAVGDADSAYAYAYDNADRLTSVDNQGTPALPRVVLTYGYDPVGNRTGVADGLGGVTSYAYDQRDQLVSLTQSGAGVAPKRADFTYDNAGDMSSMTRYSDLAGSQRVMATAYAYDDADRLTALTHQTALSGGTAVASYGYTLDAADRLTSESRTWNGGASTDTLTYGYTSDNQLTAVTHANGSFANESFGYDPNGNRNSSGDATGTNNELSTDGTYSYAYDDEGNLTSKTQIGTGNQTLYSWDFRNRLTEVDQVVGGTRSVVAAYTYDALDRRIGVTEGGMTTRTVYDGSSEVLDFNSSGQQTARYLNGPTPAGVDAVLARETSGGTVAWYLADRLGTVRDLVNDSGAVIDHVDYGVFGNVTGETNPSAGDRFKYAGMQYDAATGLDFDRARWYDPAAGRFVTQDPMGFTTGSVDTYEYVSNSPADLIDTSGLQSQAPSQSGQSPPVPTKIPPQPIAPLDPAVTLAGGGGQHHKPKVGMDPPEFETPEPGEEGCISLDPHYPNGPPPIQGKPPKHFKPGDLPGNLGDRLPGGAWQYPPGYYQTPNGGTVWLPRGIWYLPPATKYPIPNGPKGTKACKNGVFFFPTVNPVDAIPGGGHKYRNGPDGKPINIGPISVIAS